MDLIFDTHALLWLVADYRRLGGRVRDVLLDPYTRLFVSAITAWEYADLHARGRLPGSVDLTDVLRTTDTTLLNFPATLWRRAETLPPHHRDPIDRMLIAHAIEAGLTLVTADEKMRRYPVKTLW